MLSSTPTTRYLMLKVAYHRPVSSPWVVRGTWAQMNSNTVMERSMEESPLRSWGLMNHGRCCQLGYWSLHMNFGGYDKFQFWLPSIKLWTLDWNSWKKNDNCGNDCMCCHCTNEYCHDLISTTIILIMCTTCRRQRYRLIHILVSIKTFSLFTWENLHDHQLIQWYTNHCDKSTHGVG